jgi:hypothetical protein
MLATLTSSKLPTSSTSAASKLLNMFASPGEVFTEVGSAPVAPANWLVPALLVGLSSSLTLAAAMADGQTSAALGRLADSAGVSATQSGLTSGDWRFLSSLAACLAAFAGTFWSAFVLWFIGRIFLKSRFSYLKALEIAGLAGVILALGAIVTALLIVATGGAAARPALSLFAGRLDPTNHARAFLDALNLFHIWAATVLAVGLSKLSGVSFKEAAFWVFGYWFVAKIGIILLS